MELLPLRYRQAHNELINSIRMAPDIEEKKKLYDLFSQKYTMLSDLWKKRIALELPPQGTPISKETVQVCLKLKRKAMKQFQCYDYFPNRLQKMCEPETRQKLVKVYQFRFVKLDEAFPVGLIKKLKPFLTFPHSQLPRFYRYYQLNSGTPLPADIKTKYDKALESYREMITVAMKPYDWIQWMISNFSEADWIQNFECKLDEHFFMKEIWHAYIKILDERKSIDILDVYKRYCRFFVNDIEMRKKYTAKISNFSKNDKLPWILDRMEFNVDFYYLLDAGFSFIVRAIDRCLHSGTRAFLKYVLKKSSSLMCQECFEIKNQRYFNGKINLNKLMKKLKPKKAADECYVCGESLKADDSSNANNKIEAVKEMGVRKARVTVHPQIIKFQPIVEICFHDSLDPSIPLSLFHYLLKNANHRVLAKLYSSSKYFFVKERILLCYLISISNRPEKFREQVLFTNVKAILKSPIRKYCCGINLLFKDSSNPNLLSKCLSKLCCCSLETLIIDGQNLTVSEFNHLISSEKLEKVVLNEVRIFKENGKMMKIEEIISMLPTVTYLLINTKSRQLFTRRSSQKIATLFRNGTKFDSFLLYHVPDTFNLIAFKDFLRNHIQLRGYFYLGFRQNIAPQFRLEYNQLLAEVKYHWLPAYQGPQI